MFLFISRFVRSILIGWANVIPGVSGGTMAVVVGLYEEAMNALGNITQKSLIKKNAAVLAPIILGVLTGIVLFSKIILWLLENYPTPMGLFFWGLVASGLPLLIGLFQKSQPRLGGWLSLVASIGVMLVFILVSPPDKSSVAVITQRDPLMLLGFFLAGFIATSAMVIPGISGSFILLMIGLYTTVFGAIPAMDFSVIIPFFLGAILGILATAKGIQTLLDQKPNIAYGSILGLVIGSLLPLALRAYSSQSLSTSQGNLDVWFWPSCVLGLGLGLMLGLLLGKRPRS